MLQKRENKDSYLLNFKRPWLQRVNNFDIKQKRHGMFVLLYATNTKQDQGR